MNDIVRFGSGETFAVHLKSGIRIKLDCFGNRGYWIGNKMVGDFAADIRLGDVQGQMNYMIEDSSHRDNERLFSARYEDVFILWMPASIQGLDLEVGISSNARSNSPCSRKR